MCEGGFTLYMSMQVFTWVVVLQKCQDKQLALSYTQDYTSSHWNLQCYMTVKQMLNLELLIYNKTKLLCQPYRWHFVANLELSQLYDLCAVVLIAEDNHTQLLLVWPIQIINTQKLTYPISICFGWSQNWKKRYFYCRQIQVNELLSG